MEFEEDVLEAKEREVAMNGTMELMAQRSIIV